MNQEKFISSYIDLLNSTLTEAIQKNITILAQKNVIEQELKEIKGSTDNSTKGLKDTLSQKDKEIVELKNQLNDARKQKEVATGESNELRKNVQHIETFKSELVKTRSEIDRLNLQLEEKQKIIDSLNSEIFALNTKKEESKIIKKPVRKLSEEQPSVVKDAGSF
jgi:predicted RNase H-like nuclease (RuvC/YqgF family)